ncbi:hypothetical protein B296_00038702 [Ensete ventricosum]|uniref:Uncharacterized protein n=1 Tax=Ensete ventricosum TaxID=4639 RepID=A0A426YPG1_ENSVE|nr:hypothetical protein B296_00038702 [Ensete ventricosum]
MTKKVHVGYWRDGCEGEFSSLCCLPFCSLPLIPPRAGDRRLSSLKFGPFPLLSNPSRHRKRPFRSPNFRQVIRFSSRSSHESKIRQINNFIVRGAEKAFCVRNTSSCTFDLDGPASVFLRKLAAYVQETHLTNPQFLLHHQVQGLKLLSFPGAVR